MVPSEHRTLEIPLSIRLLITPVASVGKWVWSVIVIRAQKDGLALIPLFLSALGIFPIWISIAMSTTSIVLISLSISKSEAKSVILEQANTALQTEKKTLETTNQQLVTQKGALQLQYDQLKREKTDLSTDRDVVINQRGAAITEKAHVLIERDRIADENRSLNEQKAALQRQNQTLSAEKEAALVAQKELETQIQARLGELGALRAQLAQVGEYKELNQTLEQFHQLYTQVVANEGNPRGPTQMALETLIPRYQAHRARLHEQLQKTIDDLPSTDLARITLSGILRLSKEETGHVERISKALHLFMELRAPVLDRLVNNQTRGA